MDTQKFAQMQIQAEVETTIAALTSYSQYLDSSSEYAKHLQQMVKELRKSAELLAYKKE